MSDTNNSSYRYQIYDTYLTNTYDQNKNLSAKVMKYKASQYAIHFGEYLPANKDANILEIACGQGGFLLCCQQLGYQNFIGIDLSPELVDFFRNYGFTQVFRMDAFNY